MAAKPDRKLRVVADNRRARFNYEIGEVFEAGIALTGTEVKSLRQGRATIAESYADARRGEIWLVNANIPEYLQGGRFNHPPKRARKLLLHRRQIDKLAGAVEREGMTLVPLKLYFNERGRAKIELALARGKKLHDKRETESKRSWERERGRLHAGEGLISRQGRLVDPRRYLADDFKRSRISVSSSSCRDGAGGFAASRAHQPVHEPDDQEEDERHDHEIDEQGQEISPRQHGTLLFGLDQGVGRHLGRQRNEVIGKIEPARHRADDRHQDIPDQRLNDAAEGGPDDDADREINDISAQREFLEFLEHHRLPCRHIRDLAASVRPSRR